MKSFIKIEIDGTIMYNGDVDELDMVMTEYRYKTDGTKEERVFDSKVD